MPELALGILALLAGSGIGVFALHWSDSVTEPSDKPRDVPPHGPSVWRFVPLMHWMVPLDRRGSYPHEQLVRWAASIGAIGVAVVSYLVEQSIHGMLLTCLLGWMLLLLSLIDIRTFMLPDILTLPLIPAGLIATAWIEPEALLPNTLASIFALAAGWTLAAIYRGWRGREGLGGGDVKLFAAAAAWLGPVAMPGVLVYASLSGLFLVFVRRIAKRPVDRIAFGPFLSLGIWLIWLYGPPTIRFG